MWHFPELHVRPPCYFGCMDTALLNNRSAIEVWQRGFALHAKPLPESESIACMSDTTQLNLLKTAIPEISTPISVLANSRCTRTQSKGWTSQVWSKPVPPYSVYLLNEQGVSLSAPWFCFLQMASKLNLPDAIRLGMELCGTHSTLPFTAGIELPFSLSEREVKNGFVSCPPVCTAEQLRRMLVAAHVGPRTKAVYAARFVVDNSRSPGESRLYLLICLPVNLGGYGLPRPLLNVRLKIPEELRRIVGSDHYVCDLYYPGASLAIEYDGGYHWDGEQRMDDNLRELILNTLGIEVIRIDKKQLENPEALDIQAHRIAKCLGVRLRRPNESVLEKRIQLRSQVLDWSSKLYG